MKILNLTGYSPICNEVVVNLSEAATKEVAALLKFNHVLPNGPLIRHNCKLLADMADKLWDTGQHLLPGMDLPSVKRYVLISAPILMIAELDRQLRKRGLTPVYALAHELFNRQVSDEQRQEPGDSLIRHGFVDPQNDES